MTCKELTDFIEPIAGGDIEPDAAMRAHFETCPACASALASARRIETALAADEIPPAPAKFTSLVLQRIRRERWRMEQNVDRLFNLAILASVLIVAAGVLALMNLSGLAAGAAEVWAVMPSLSGLAARAAVPSVDTYVAAGGLLATALGMWWWAERRLSL